MSNVPAVAAGAVVVVAVVGAVGVLARRRAEHRVSEERGPKLVEPGLATPPRDPERGRARRLRRRRGMNPRANGHSKESGNLG